MEKLIGDPLFPVLADDSLLGTAADEYIYGGGGNDTVSGGDGVDSIDGGAGSADWITFASVSSGIEINLQAVAVPVEPMLLMSMEESSAAVVGFDTTSTIVADPLDAGNTVVKVVKGTGALGAAGTTMYTGPDQSIEAIPFTADSTTMTLRVYMAVPEAGIKVRLKVEDANNNQHTVETDAFTTDAEGWQTLTFDFANAATNDGNPTARLDLSHTFNKVSVFFNFGTSTAAGGGGTFYFDDLKFIDSPDASGTIADDGYGNTDSIANIENVLGSSFGDRITGGSGANTLQGAAGNDTIDGGSGNDRLEGGDGNDTMQGGNGNDNLIGGAGNDTLAGGDGIDTYDGGDGSDVISFSTAEAGVEVVLRSGTSTTTVVDFDESTPPLFTDFGPDDGNPDNAGVNVGSVAADPEGGGNQVGKFVKGVAAETWAGVIVSTGPNFSVDTLALTATDNTMSLRVWTEKPGVQVLLKLENASNSGINTGAFATTSVTGGWETLTFAFGPALSGPNTGEFNPANTYNKAVLFFDFGLNGTAGAGTFYFDDLKVLSTAVGEVVDDGYGNAEVVANVERVTGSAFADKLTGDAKSNTFSAGDGVDTLIGGGGNDKLDGGTGADSMVGGTGNDSYVVQNGADVIVEAASGGTDSVSTSVSYSLSAEIENLTLTGTNNSTLTGNSLANKIVGNGGNNKLDGGTNADTMTGGAGNDSYVVQNGLDVIVEQAGGGTDSVSTSVTYTLSAEIEKLKLTGTNNSTLTGNSLANTITGNGGNNVLDGGSNADTLTGGAGNDSYKVQNSGDVVVELAGGGTDSVSSTISYTLAAEVEKLTLTGSSDLSGTGNSLNNTLVGNSGDNQLRGSTGNDTLTGGAGLDIFRFSSAINTSTNVDTVLDFNTSDDILQLENTIFVKLTTTGVLSTSNFRASTTGTAGDSNDYVLYETDTGNLYYDADGSGSGTKQLIAHLDNLPTLTAADIFVT